jgi:hypothetical protein
MTRKIFELKTIGETLTTREQGALAREILSGFLREVDTEKVVIDFNEVILTTHGFIDEFLGKLIEEFDQTSFTSKIGFKNLGDHKKIVNYVITDRWKDIE